MEARTNFYGLCLSGFLAKASYALARTPVLALFAASFGVGPEAIGFAVAISTITGVFFKMPAGVISDIIGRRRTMLIGLVFFAVIPFLYLLVHSYNSLLVVRFLHGFATAIYGPVIMAVVVDIAGSKRGEMLSFFSSVTIVGNLIGAPLGGFLLGRLADGGDTAACPFPYHLRGGCRSRHGRPADRCLGQQFDGGQMAGTAPENRPFRRYSAIFFTA